VSLPGIGILKIKDPASYPETQGSENMSVNDLTSLAAYVKLGIAPQPHKNLARRYN